MLPLNPIHTLPNIPFNFRYIRISMEKGICYLLRKSLRNLDKLTHMMEIWEEDNLFL